MKLNLISLENVKIINGSVLVPDPLIFNTREDAIYFGDSRKVASDIIKEKYTPEKIDFIYQQVKKQ